MPGMNRETGKPLNREAHINQSIRDILTTPIGSRVHRRDYGSRLFQLVDRPINPSLTADATAAAAEALQRWEPRIALDRIIIEEGTQPTLGILSITVVARRLPDSQVFRLENVTIR